MTRRRRYGLAGLSVLASAAIAFLLEAGELLVVRKAVDSPEAVISLGSHEWERLPLAAEIANRFPSSMVVLTLPKFITPYNCDDCLGRQRRLERMGVAPKRVTVLTLQSSTTLGEADACLKLLSRSGVKRIVIVTSPYHTRRALAVFRAVFATTGIEVGVEPASATSSARPSRWWRSPYDRWYVAYEWAAIVYYAARYRVLQYAI